MNPYLLKTCGVMRRSIRINGSIKKPNLNNYT